MQEIWFASRLWLKRLDYPLFLLSFVKPTVEELKKLNLLKRWYFLFQKDHINFMVRIDERVVDSAEVEGKIKSVIHTHLKKIKDLMDETKSPNPEHPQYSGETSTFGEDGWGIIQKFFEIGSEFALCTVDPDKKKVIPGTMNGFTVEKLIHCFLNQTKVDYDQEFLFYLKRLVELKGLATYEIDEIKLRRLR